MTDIKEKVNLEDKSKNIDRGKKIGLKKQVEIDQNQLKK
jgi:hypothetical protein